MLDVDGTIIPVKFNALPSLKVLEAINRAKEKLHISLVTSRPLFLMNEILDYLNLSGPSVINGGSQIIDAKTRKILWERTIDKNDLKAVVKAVDGLTGISIIDSDNGSYTAEKVNSVNKAVKVVVEGLNPIQAEQMLKKFSKISAIAAYKSTSFTNNTYDLIVSHASATKQHAIFEIKKLLDIRTEEIIGVGDAHNDFPLLAACGIKIAMGNAVRELKNIADYIAPDINKDGVAAIIEKFILAPSNEHK